MGLDEEAKQALKKANRLDRTAPHCWGLLSLVTLRTEGSTPLAKRALALGLKLGLEEARVLRMRRLSPRS